VACSSDEAPAGPEDDLSSEQDPSHAGGEGDDLSKGDNPSEGDDPSEGDGATPAEPEPDTTFSGATVCTSESYWLRGDHESPLMHPGRACIDCHSEERKAPDLTIAGTVFATGHEFDDCNGEDGEQADLSVEITDANGKVFTLTPNAAGNFYSEKSVSFPISARVKQGGRERAMLGKVSSGDCNSCHTDRGAESAPGRIARP
jgi:hypothetical protein